MSHLHLSRYRPFPQRSDLPSFHFHPTQNTGVFRPAHSQATSGTLSGGKGCCSRALPLFPFIQEIQDDRAFHTVAAGDEMATSIVRFRPHRRQVGSDPLVGSVLLLFIPEQVKRAHLAAGWRSYHRRFYRWSGGPIHLAAGLLGVDFYLISGGDDRPAQQCGSIVHRNLLQGAGPWVDFIGVYHDAGHLIGYGEGIGADRSLCRDYFKSVKFLLCYFFAQIVALFILGVVVVQPDGLQAQGSGGAGRQGKGILQFQAAAVRVQIPAFRIDRHIVIDQIFSALVGLVTILSQGDFAVRNIGRGGISSISAHSTVLV